MFRNVSPRVLRNTSILYGASQVQQPKGSPKLSSELATVQDVQTCCAIGDSCQSGETHWARVPYGLALPINELGAQFFFVHYTCDKPPFSDSYRAWLTAEYFESDLNAPLRNAIEAAGMSGIANKFNAPQVAFEAREKYHQALVHTKRTLDGYVASLTDTTLATVIYLGLFEVIWQCCLSTSSGNEH
jgi:hypothetical protein